MRGSGVVRVVITGAAGRIGREMVEELSVSHELRLVDRVPVSGRSGVIADLGRPPSVWWRRLASLRSQSGWERALEGADVILHLAADARPRAPVESVLADNVRATWNVLEGAARCGVRRVIFASSCRWVLGLDPDTAPDWDTVQIDSTSPPRPRTPYGLSKAWGELATRMYVETGRLHSAVAVRIGAFNEREPTDPEIRRLWVRPQDLRSVLRRCTEVEFEGFHVVYAVSREAAGPFDLSGMRELLGWEPGKT
jgi:nucleoside-diphosphate-sugar epimerase